MVKLEEVNISNILAHPFIIWFATKLKDSLYWKDFYLLKWSPRPSAKSVVLLQFPQHERKETCIVILVL